MAVHRHKVVVVTGLRVEHLDALRVATDAQVGVLIILLAHEHHLHAENLGTFGVTVEAREVLGVVDHVRELREDGSRLISLSLLAGGRLLTYLPHGNGAIVTARIQHLLLPDDFAENTADAVGVIGAGRLEHNRRRDLKIPQSQ